MPIQRSPHNGSPVGFHCRVSREPAERDHGDTLRGWQRAAAACLDKSACVYFDLDPASRALMLSQAGPGGSLAITALPTAPEFRMPSSHMRVLLLRRLRQPLSLAPRTCRCGGALDPLGDHRAACPTAGVLGALPACSLASLAARCLPFAILCLCCVTLLRLPAAALERLKRKNPKHPTDPKHQPQPTHTAQRELHFGAHKKRRVCLVLVVANYSSTCLHSCKLAEQLLEP